MKPTSYEAPNYVVFNLVLTELTMAVSVKSLTQSALSVWGEFPTFRGLPLMMDTQSMQSCNFTADRPKGLHSVYQPRREIWVRFLHDVHSKLMRKQV